MLELALLGLLKERPMHGYDLRKRLREDFGPLANLSFGSLYPALARLERSGAVRATATDRTPPLRDVAPAMVPLTGSLGGERAALVARLATTKAAAALGSHGTRGRKVYEITGRGDELFEQLLETADSAGEDGRSFSVRLAFARYLTPASRERLLERRRLQLADRLTHARRSLEAPARPLDRYEQALAAHARDIAASDLAWVEGLLHEERERSVRPGRPDLFTMDGTAAAIAGPVPTGTASIAGAAEQERNDA
ncbi:MAG: PadR family transcriptional regulator [Actinomycetota bacterium]|nr:PadR family transcriptional regulator [Actinomycetota bacterium]